MCDQKSTMAQDESLFEDRGIDFHNDGFAGHQQVGIIFLVNNSNYVNNSRNKVKK